MTAAACLPLDQRDQFLRLVAARVQAAGRHPTDAAVDQALREVIAMVPAAA